VVSFRGVKRPERQVDHTPPSSAKVINECGYTSTPPYALLAWKRTTSAFLLPAGIVIGGQCQTTLQYLYRTYSRRPNIK